MSPMATATTSAVESTNGQRRDEVAADRASAVRVTPSLHAARHRADATASDSSLSPRNRERVAARPPRLRPRTATQTDELQDEHDRRIAIRLLRCGNDRNRPAWRAGPLGFGYPIIARIRGQADVATPSSSRRRRGGSLGSGGGRARKRLSARLDHPATANVGRLFLHAELRAAQVPQDRFLVAIGVERGGSG